MPRELLTDNERDALKDYVKNLKPQTTTTRVILSRLRKMKLSEIHQDYLLLEQVFERLVGARKK